MLLGTQANSGNWWEKYPVVGDGAPPAPASAAPPPAPTQAPPSAPSASFPGVIYGAPKPDAALDTTLKQGQIAAQQRDAASAPLDEKLKQVQLAGEMKKLDNPTLTESQGQATGFYKRAMDANGAFEKTNAATHPRNWAAQMLADAAPQDIVNSMTSADRQSAEQAKYNFILATLRQDSGASINADEYIKQARIYFPQPGDDPATIAQKAQTRKDAILGLEASAGPGAQVASDAQRGQPQGNVVFNDQMPAERANAVHLTPDQLGEVSALIQSGAAPEMVQAYVKNRFNLEADPAQLAEAAKFYANPSNRNVEPAVTVDNSVKPVKPEGNETVGAALRGVSDSLTLGAAPRLGALVDMATEGGSYGDNLDRERGNLAYDQQNHPVAHALGELGGGLMLPTGDATTAADLAKLGAKYGGAYGVLSSDDLSSPGGIGKAALGGVSGAASSALGGYLGGKLAAGIGSKLAARPAPPPSKTQGLVDAATRQNVPITVADAAPSTRPLYGALESMPLAGGAVRKAVQKGNDALERRVDEVGGAGAADRATMGDTIQQAGERWSAQAKNRVSQAYDRAVQLAGGQQITPTEAVKVLDRHIADLERAPGQNSSVLNLLKTYRGDLVDATGAAKPVDLDVIRGMRTNLRGNIDTDALRHTSAEHVMGQVLGGANQDIDAQLTGPALRYYKRADRLHAGTTQSIDNVVKAFLGGRGPKAMSAEQTANKVASLASPTSGDAETLGKMMAGLEPAERQQVGATIAAELGRRGADGDNAFSAARFFGDIQKFSPGARKAIWGAKGARDLADLARLAEQRGFVNAKMNNSRSGAVGNFRAILGGLIGGGVATASGAGTPAAIVAGGTVGTSYLSAKILGSPKAVSALAWASRATTPASQAAAVRQLGQIAAKEPALAQDLLPIKEKLEKALGMGTANRRR